MDTSKVITRFPPSPTGKVHIGNIRTMVFNYLYAEQHNGEMMVRFEDTDRERSKPEYEIYITEALAWLGINDYQQPWRQSERTEIYKSYLEKLISEDKAYISTEEPREAGQRTEVIRFKNPNKEITFNDLIRGEITVDTTDLGDFVIAKSLLEPIYHFAVVVDDYESGITHVIRGEDHISNTPRQILIQQSISAPMPTYAHLPMVLGSDKSKLSKRHGATSLEEFREQGYLPVAVFNYLTLLGWHPSNDDREIFTVDELIQAFKLTDVQKAGAVFSYEKLRWVNKQHLLKLSDSAFFKAIIDWIPDEIKSLNQYSEERLARFIPELRDRIEVYSDVQTMAREGELDYIFEAPGYFADKVVWRKSSPAETLEHLKYVTTLLESAPESVWNTTESIKQIIWPYAEIKGKGDVLWPVRYALSGVDRSPDPITLLYILQKQESLNRIKVAIEKLETNNESV